MKTLKFSGPYLFDSLINRNEYSNDIQGCIKRTFLNNNLNVINHKYFYYSFSSTINYLKAIRFDDYTPEYNDEFKTEVHCFLEWCRSGIDNNFEFGKPIAYFSLGCGDGEKDKEIIDGLQSKFQSKIDYFPIDFSYFLLNMTVGKIQKLNDMGGIFPYNIDFNCMGSLMNGVNPSDKTTIFSLLGNTIGNYKEELLLSQISAIMKSGDYLLIGHRIISDETVTSVSNEGNSAFLLQPLKYFIKGNLNKKKISTEFVNNKSLSNIENSKSAIVYYIQNQNDIIRLTYSTRYEKNSFVIYLNGDNKFNLKFIDQFYNEDTNPSYSLVLYEKAEDIQSLFKSILQKLEKWLTINLSSDEKVRLKNIQNNMNKNPITEVTFLTNINDCQNPFQFIKLFSYNHNYKSYLKELLIK
ncbi:MAG: L-histidine N(alpha)-methyltransferase [Pseudomonadota bacterium]